mmetsp:Transcript_10557/g.14135  ORF Transcript_10557/g.14135 Transcript_10557/m.14135 type:complete len:462 (-) Transcript_10557:52-1437(-)
MAEESPKNDFLDVIDKKTKKHFVLPIRDGSISASDLSKEGYVSYDPGYLNTASCTSTITEINGEEGRLLYRGYPVEQLTSTCSYLEVAHLLIFGELPTRSELEDWERDVMGHTHLHEDIATMLRTFRYDAHPMGMFISTMAALSTYYPSGNPALKTPSLYQDDPQLCSNQIARIIGKAPSLAACAFRHRIGRPYNKPAFGLGYTENFLYMMDKMSEPHFKPHPILTQVLDKCFILHADHELNCSTATMRQVGSTLVDPFTGVASAASALYGPLHGGANEAVLRMLTKIGSIDKVPEFIESVKARKEKLMGFGHRVYKNYDPRARILRELSTQVFELLGKNPLVEVAVELEKVALSDPFFVQRKLYPNVDFYSGLIYQSMGFPTDMFPVLFAIPRTSGWLAHWNEGLKDKGVLYRPRQIFKNFEPKEYTPIESREEKPELDQLIDTYSVGSSSIRRSLALMK